MIKKIIPIIMILLLTGCYDHQELNSLSILTATEINKTDDVYTINAQVVNPQSPDKTTYAQTPFFIYTGTGKTIQEAYRQIKLKSSRYIYPDHLTIVIIDLSIAKNDISQILDFYLRNPLARTEFKVLIGKKENILNTITPIDGLSSTSILDNIETNSKYYGISSLISLSDLAKTKINPNTEIILPTIDIIDTNKDNNTIENATKTTTNSSYILEGLAIFKDNKLKGYLTNDESITYNLIQNNINDTIITYECQKDNYLSLEITKNKTKITTKNKEININISLEGIINESACNIDLNNKTNIDSLTNNINNYLNENIKNNIDNIRKKYNSDIFGFLDIIYKHDYKYYQEIKENWYNSIYQNIKINIYSSLNILTKGNVSEDINEKN